MMIKIGYLFPTSLVGPFPLCSFGCFRKMALSKSLSSLISSLPPHLDRVIYALKSNNFLVGGLAKSAISHGIIWACALMSVNA